MWIKSVILKLKIKSEIYLFNVKPVLAVWKKMFIFSNHNLSLNPLVTALIFSTHDLSWNPWWPLLFFSITISRGTPGDLSCNQRVPRNPSWETLVYVFMSINPLFLNFWFVCGGWGSIQATPFHHFSGPMLVIASAHINLLKPSGNFTYYQI
jgi:hypothetical protein